MTLHGVFNPQWPRANVWSVVTLSVLTCTAFAYPRPPEGMEDIPRQMSDSALVCKGEVVDAPPPKFVPTSAGMPRLAATAYVRPDRCFKGTPPNPAIPVRFDGFQSGADFSFVLRKGDYRLFFLTPQDRNYAVVDWWFGAPMARSFGRATSCWRRARFSRMRSGAVRSWQESYRKPQIEFVAKSLILRLHHVLKKRQR